jgi:glycyl-tRNA synthetase beta subunit
VTEAAQKQVLDFCWSGRGSFCWERRGFAYDEINAAFAAGADDLVDAAERVAAVHAIRRHEEFRAAGGFVQAHPEHSGEVGGSSG